MALSIKTLMHGIIRESFGPVIIYSLLFHSFFFIAIMLMTKALYKSHEFERPYTFELVKLSQVFETEAPPVRSSSARPKVAKPATVAPVPPVAAPSPVDEKKPVPGEQKSAPAPVAPAAASPAPSAVVGPANDVPVDLDRVYESGMVDELPVLVKKPDPFYPEFVKDQGIAGTVKAQVVIDQNGNVIDIKILSSPHELLSDEVIKAVSRWKYKPGKFRGMAVKVKSRDVQVVFQLTD